MSCCVLLRDGHGGGGRWLTVEDGGGGFVAVLLAVLAGVDCWENGGVEGRWRCWCVRSCGGQLLGMCCRRGDVGVR